MRHLIVLCLALLFSNAALNHPGKLASSLFWQIAPVFSMAALANGAGGSRYELGAGLQGDLYLWRLDNWLLGPGLGVFATSPTGTGNASVRVSPYAIYAEQRLSSWWVLSGDHVAFLPSLSIFSTCGAEIFHRQVRRNRSINAAALISIGSRVGLAFCFQNWGCHASYDLSFGTNKIRQQILIGMSYHWFD